MQKKLWQHIEKVRQTSPLVQNITNYVVMNNTANALLAAGASPIMAHAHPEIDEMATICQAIVLNIGTLDEYKVKSMLLAIKKAGELGKPTVLDPVGAGATGYRNETLSQLLEYGPTVIRGNASEILALAKQNTETTKGVDSTAQSNEALSAAKSLNKEYGSVVCISGETDIVVNGDREIHLSNGHALMAKVTGMGCSVSALIGAFIAVVEDKTEAVAAAMALMGVVGELAEKQSSGPGSLQMHLLDKLHNLTEDEFIGTLKYSEK